MEILTSLISFILSIIDSLGYIGIFLGMSIESSFIPFPSEIILVPAGALIAQGKMSFSFVLIAGILGSLTGALINYFLALYFGRKSINILLDKYGKFLFLNKEKLQKSDNYFKRHGEITTFIGRLIPVIRQLISLPAGFSKMKLSRFILFTSLGAGIWSFVLIIIGYFYGSSASYISKLFTTIIIGLIILISFIIYLVPKKKPSPQSY
jgi:membrane protein DedA with SNARE-associated domain